MPFLRFTGQRARTRGVFPQGHRIFARSVFYFPFAVLLSLPTTPQEAVLPKFQRKVLQKVFSLLNTEKIEKCQFYNAKFSNY